MSKFTHWVPAQGCVDFCTMRAYRNRLGERLYTGRNGHTVWCLTPIRNRVDGDPEFMLIAYESLGVPPKPVTNVSEVA